METHEELLRQIKIIVGVSGIIVTVISAVITIIAIQKTIKSR